MHATQVLSFVCIVRKLFDMKPGTHYSQTCIVPLLIRTIWRAVLGPENVTQLCLPSVQVASLH